MVVVVAGTVVIIGAVVETRVGVGVTVSVGEGVKVEGIGDGVLVANKVGRLVTD